MRDLVRAQSVDQENRTAQLTNVGNPFRFLHPLNVSQTAWFQPLDITSQKLANPSVERAVSVPRNLSNPENKAAARKWRPLGEKDLSQQKSCLVTLEVNSVGIQFSTPDQCE